MIVLYNLVTSIAPGILKLISPFSPKIKGWLNGALNWKEEIGASKVSESNCNIWFHCASLGEFEQGKPLMEALKLQYPQISIIVTFFSPSGYNARKNSQLASYVGYLPIDSEHNAEDFLAFVKPKMAVFVKSEIWPNFLSALKTKRVPTFLLSARFIPGQTILKKRGKFFLNQLKNFDLIFVQNSTSQVLLKKFRIDSVLSGDTRYDQVSELLTKKKLFPVIESFCKNQHSLIAGSCWPEDLGALQPFLSDTKVKIIIAPHDVSPKMIDYFKSNIVNSTILYSQINPETALNDYQVILIDSIGMLASLYSYGEVAYVGGALKQGLHNILEPAVYGKPVIFGPDISGFPEAGEIINEGGAFSIKNGEELKSVLTLLYNDSSHRNMCGNKNREFIEKRKGATEKVMTSLKTILTNQKCFKN